ncbi:MULTISPECIES: 4Fe-4S dicluster domain-containing protein [unclassified Adlercreutzia]|uniref:4Fe-4S dicluster domain-containing protein n=1 Tax=unclassified Adlercreutzia TaxID=2636013 RepID=UPI0013EAEC44|nr:MULTISPECIES: 4Fe-4S dicluster domain-containing protein [unclassified Adlercreutzia]
MTKFGMAINLDRCMGCNTCAMACKMQNNVPMGMMWNRVIVEGCENEFDAQGTYPNLARTYLPIACQHCENPACQRVCPTGATYKDDKGRVQIDYDKCIGCRMCMAACPYNARVFNWNDPVRDPDFCYGDAGVPVRSKGVMEKCTMCKERTDRGDEPMCVRCCPAEARTFGDLDDPSSEVSRLIREKSAYVLLPEQGTRPQVRYFN